MRADLIEAYNGVYDNYADEAECGAKSAEEHILRHSPKQRLHVYLQWNGILGFTETIYAIATGEVK